MTRRPKITLLAREVSPSGHGVYGHLLFWISNTFEWGISSKSLYWGSTQGSSRLFGLLAQNPRCLYVQTEYLWMAALVFPSYLPSRPPPPRLHHSRFSPCVIRNLSLPPNVADRWCQQYIPWQQRKPDPCQPSGCSPSPPLLHRIASTAYSLFKKVFRQRSNCSETFIKQYLQAYSYASARAFLLSKSHKTLKLRDKHQWF